MKSFSKDAKNQNFLIGNTNKIYFDAVFFDLDGTLVDSSTDIGLAANYVREQMNLPRLEIDLIKSYVGDGVRLLMSRALQSEDASLLDRAISIWEPFYKVNCLLNTVLYPGIEQVLEQLHSDRIPMAVVSNKPACFCEQILEGLKIEKYFGSVVGGDSAPNRKPHPEPMWLAAEQLKLTSKSILVVGDSSHDITAANKAGYKSCGVLWGIGLEKNIRAAGPDHVIQMPSDIPRLIRTVPSHE
jgi:phosphoglycolate phosphatase